jgi:hypothetical protein
MMSKQKISSMMHKGAQSLNTNAIDFESPMKTSEPRGLSRSQTFEVFGDAESTSTLDNLDELVQMQRQRTASEKEQSFKRLRKVGSFFSKVFTSEKSEKESPQKIARRSTPVLQPQKHELSRVNQEKDSV